MESMKQLQRRIISFLIRETWNYFGIRITGKGYARVVIVKRRQEKMEDMEINKHIVYKKQTIQKILPPPPFEIFYYFLKTP